MKSLYCTKLPNFHRFHIIDGFSIQFLQNLGTLATILKAPACNPVLARFPDFLFFNFFSFTRNNFNINRM